MTRRGFLVSLAVSFLQTPRLAEARPQPGREGATPPPVSWSCPMHAEVVDAKPGTCPICGMALEPLRLALVWSCPVHSDVTKPGAGRCPRCGRDLIRVTKALSFTCPVHQKVTVLDPGRCPICKRTLVTRYTIRPHGDHNPKHGGQFMMVSNNWHLEVTHPAPDVFRLYVYDQYSKPFLPPGLSARVVEAPDAAGTKKDVSITFSRPAGRPYLDVRVPHTRVPATIAVKARFEENDKEYRFDFPFFHYSTEPAAGRRR